MLCGVAAALLFLLLPLLLVVVLLKRRPPSKTRVGVLFSTRRWVVGQQGEQARKGKEAGEQTIKTWHQKTAEEGAEVDWATEQAHMCSQ